MKMSKKKCPDCNGTGEKGWSLARPVVYCERCKGTGKINDC